eukprot:scaffold5930_cov177-Cylindrotheca_fusiformis.AAC.5
MKPTLLPTSAPNIDTVFVVFFAESIPSQNRLEITSVASISFSFSLSFPGPYKTSCKLLQFEESPSSPSVTHSVNSPTLTLETLQPRSYPFSPTAYPAPAPFVRQTSIEYWLAMMNKTHQRND